MSVESEIRNFLPELALGDYYLVTFLSIRKEGADEIILNDLDENAYQQAALSSDLIFYHRGNLDDKRECLSFCIWKKRKSAEMAASSSPHRQAMEAVNKMYDSYTLSKYLLRKTESEVVFERLSN